MNGTDEPNSVLLLVQIVCIAIPWAFNRYLVTRKPLPYWTWLMYISLGVPAGIGFFSLYQDPWSFFSLSGLTIDDWTLSAYIIITKMLPILIIMMIIGFLVEIVQLLWRCYRSTS